MSNIYLQLRNGISKWIDFIIQSIDFKSRNDKSIKTLFSTNIFVKYVEKKFVAKYKSKPNFFPKSFKTFPPFGTLSFYHGIVLHIKTDW